MINENFIFYQQSAKSSGGAGSGSTGSAAQVLRVFDYFGKCRGEAGVSEVAEALGVHKSTASRLLATLKAGGYLERSDYTGKYTLGVRFLELANAKLDQFDLRSYARPYLEDLAQQTKETVHLAIVEHGKLIYIDKVDTQYTLIMRSRIGHQVAPHCTALGKIILSVLSEAERDAILSKAELTRSTPNTITDPAMFKQHLEVVASQGFAFDDEENEEGIRCAAGVVRNHTGGVAGAISVSAPIMRMSRQRMENTGVLVRETCRKLSTSLGYKADHLHTE